MSFCRRSYPRASFSLVSILLLWASVIGKLLAQDAPVSPGAVKIEYLKVGFEYLNHKRDLSINVEEYDSFSELMRSSKCSLSTFFVDGYQTPAPVSVA